MMPRHGQSAGLARGGRDGVTLNKVAICMLSLVAWLWTLRAGKAIGYYGSGPTPRRKTVAIGNMLVSLIPLALAVYLTVNSS